MADEPHPMDAFLKQVASLENEIGASPGTFRAFLLNDQDWSFLIKSHALIEGALSVLLAASLDPRLAEVFAFLELGDVRAGKLAFAKALDLLSTPHRRFITTLSALRNKAAHDIRHADFNFQRHRTSLNPVQRRDFDNSFLGLMSDETRPGWAENLEDGARLRMNMGVIVILVHLHTRLRLAGLDSKQKALDAAFAAGANSGAAEIDPS